MSEMLHPSPKPILCCRPAPDVDPPSLTALGHPDAAEALSLAKLAVAFNESEATPAIPPE